MAILLQFSHIAVDKTTIGKATRLRKPNELHSFFCVICAFAAATALAAKKKKVN
jgi:hypothetical protein